MKYIQKPYSDNLISKVVVITWIIAAVCLLAVIFQVICGVYHFIKFIFGGIYITDFLVTLLIFIPIVLLITNNQ